MRGDLDPGTASVRTSVGVNREALGMGEAAPQPPPPAKYRNEPTTVDGVRFDSKREAAEWVKLKALEAAGSITALRRQVPFRLEVKGVHVCDYVADFVWHEGGLLVVADVKSPATRRNRAYRIKRKLMRAVYQIDIREL